MYINIFIVSTSKRNFKIYPHILIFNILMTGAGLSKVYPQVILILINIATFNFK